MCVVGLPPATLMDYKAVKNEAKFNNKKILGWNVSYWKFKQHLNLSFKLPLLQVTFKSETLFWGPKSFDSIFVIFIR